LKKKIITTRIQAKGIRTRVINFISCASSISLLGLLEHNIAQECQAISSLKKRVCEEELINVFPSFGERGEG
jgi:hypothetical protein